MFWKRIAIACLGGCLISAGRAFADAPTDSRPFKSPPYSYTAYGGGNCVWFVWEMAYQKWGIALPWVGDAKMWTSLDGAKVQGEDGKEYTLTLTSEPTPKSIAIFQPEDLRTLAGGSFPNDYFGHVAWVEDAWRLVSAPGLALPPDMILVLESTVYPPSNGKYWHGCWYEERIYKISGLKSLKFLTLKE